MRSSVSRPGSRGNEMSPRQPEAITDSSGIWPSCAASRILTVSSRDFSPSCTAPSTRLLFVATRIVRPTTLSADPASVSDAVDLQEDHTRDVGRSSTLACGGSLDDAAVVEVVVDSQERRDDRVYHREDEGRYDAPEHPNPEAVDVPLFYRRDGAVKHLRCYPQGALGDTRSD